jgi:hypothetical protein
LPGTLSGPFGAVFVVTPVKGQITSTEYVSADNRPTCSRCSATSVLSGAVLAGMSQGGFVSLCTALTAPGRVRALVLIDSEAAPEDPAIAPGYEQMHQAWLDNGPGPVQEVVASIILGPGRWDDWYAKWYEQYAQWAPHDLGQLAWPFRCLMDRDDITGRLAEITCPTLIVHGTADAAIPCRAPKRSGTACRPGHVHCRRGRSARFERDPSGRGEPGHPRVPGRAGRRVKRRRRTTRHRRRAFFMRTKPGSAPCSQ